MSKDIVTFKRFGNDVRFEVACSCLPSLSVRANAEKAPATQTAFNHIDGVTLLPGCGPEDVLFYDVERDCLALFDGEEGCSFRLEDPVPNDLEYEAFNKLRELFHRDRWPTYGQIADAVAGLF